MTAMTMEQRYATLVAHLNQAMLVTETDRVPLLRRIMQALGHPDRELHVIHLAGTNGKGSTGAMLAQILQAQGYRVGRFSSPAINDEREQLQLNGQWISQAAFVTTYQAIVPTLTQLGLVPADISIFEWYFLIGMVWFRQQKVQWAIVEAGLGGQYDATNALSAPQLTVFTKIALDHMQILGSTITAIAKNKAQIIKPQTTVVTLADQNPAAKAVLQAQATAQSVPLITANHLVMTNQRVTIQGTIVDATSDLFQWSQLKLGLIGAYQVQNLGLVLTAIAVLRRQMVPISDTAVRQGLRQVRLPGRLTLLQADPLMLADGAHNPDGMRALVRSVRQLLPAKQLIWVLGVLRDKAYAEMLVAVLPAAALVITNTPANPKRALPATELAQAAKALNPQAEVLVATDIQAAITLAQQRGTDDSAIIIAGSFYVMRELQQAGWPGLAND
ncbi:bifunctional folylpolyglutamate synthase/dihydrofolate synthase [Lactobacillus sp. CBA3606]|uniref:bifunctional folylpolyglutamate synthase/dihydrofolate synthase n=1 Tax=Lactobacillus sp. CBA3606 TaxID=2099789 RepID=UPI000CFA919B|nr:cyanophycin synthetase [Lactobacillus sp. CBA3606]AVK63895.1 bifunctional folylpolyglutamate synthase/dihydrofolate synthase [Lactobacillus sp. CBA3606]